MTVLCDFCSAANPVWSFDCATYPVPDLGVVSQGAWLACEDCAALIRGEAWQDLAGRGCLTPTGRMLARTIGKPEAIRQIGDMHAGFRLRRTGEFHRLEM